MGYLLYCILSTLENQSLGALVGVDDQPVFLVSHNGLSAAISKINRSNVTLEISRILAYQRVIESFHCHPAVEGVIPVRYGSLFEEKPHIIGLLKERCKHYKALLKELEGCVEMGIRILIADCGVRSAEHDSQKFRIPHSAFGIPKSENPGRAYLAARKAHYAQQEKFNKQAKEVIEQYRAAFNGLFVKCKTEFPSIDSPSPCGIPHRGSPTSRGIPQGGLQSSIINRQSTIPNPVLSLYFLVQREHVERFQGVFRQVNVRESPKLLLSGPWPPYNFVQPDHIYGQDLVFPSPCEQGDFCHFVTVEEATKAQRQKG